MKNIRKFLGIILITIFLFFSGCSNEKAADFSIADFVPQEPMVKYFDGGFENFGEVELIDIITPEAYQTKSLNLGTGVIQVYRISKDKIITVFSKETEEFKENYLNEESNTFIIQLQEPIEVGTQWNIYANNISEITGINVKVDTPYDNFRCIEVTSFINDTTIKHYYAKNIGLVKTVFSDYYSSSLIAIDNDISSIDINDVEKTLNELYEKMTSRGDKK